MNTLHHLGVPHSRGNRERFNGGCIRRHIKRGQSTVHLYCLLKRYDAIVVKEQIPVVVVSALSSMQSYQRGEVGSTAIHGGRRSANQRLLIFSVYTVSFNFHPFSCRVHRVRQIDRICCVGCSIVGGQYGAQEGGGEGGSEANFDSSVASRQLCAGVSSPSLDSLATLNVAMPG